MLMEIFNWALAIVECIIGGIVTVGIVQSALKAAREYGKTEQQAFWFAAITIAGILFFVYLLTNGYLGNGHINW